jgi:iron complex transport system substrate-binding protein
MIRTLGALVGATDRANALTERLAANLESTRRRTANHGKRPKVYFEEWDEPMISGIGWVSELITIAGGVDIFPEFRRAQVREGSDRHARSSDRSRA